MVVVRRRERLLAPRLRSLRRRRHLRRVPHTARQLYTKLIGADARIVAYPRAIGERARFPLGVESWRRDARSLVRARTALQEVVIATSIGLVAHKLRIGANGAVHIMVETDPSGDLVAAAWHV